MCMCMCNIVLNIFKYIFVFLILFLLFLFLIAQIHKQKHLCFYTNTHFTFYIGLHQFMFWTCLLLELTLACGIKPEADSESYGSVGSPGSNPERRSDYDGLQAQCDQAIHQLQLLRHKHSDTMRRFVLILILFYFSLSLSLSLCLILSSFSFTLVFLSSFFVFFLL